MSNEPTQGLTETVAIQATPNEIDLIDRLAEKWGYETRWEVLREALRQSGIVLGDSGEPKNVNGTARVQIAFAKGKLRAVQEENATLRNALAAVSIADGCSPDTREYIEEVLK